MAYEIQSLPNRPIVAARTWTSLALIVASIAGTRAVAVAQEITQVASVEGITEYVLPNGLRVLLFPDASKPTTTVNITYFVGSRHEGYGETGMAHLLEHLAFKGTPDHPDIPQELTERGAFPNATTWFDRTNYYETFPATQENLEWALDLEADRMVHSFISKEDLESEMTVVRNEMEWGENSPIRILRERILSTAYLWHNYGNSTIGARSDVENVPIERLQAFYRKYYQPDNAMLVIAGKFDEAKALELVVEKFGSIPRPDRSGANYIYQTYTSEPTQDGERSVTLRRVGETQLVMAGYHIPPGSHEEFAAVELLDHALSDRPSGRLHEALVEAGKAARVGSFLFQLKEAGPLLLYAEVREEDSLDEAWDIMRHTLDEVIERPVTEEELERARTALLKDIELAFNNSEEIALDLSEWASMDDWRLIFIHRDRLRAAKLEDVQRVAATYLKRANRTVGFFIPTDEPDRAAVPSAPDVVALVKDYKGDEVVAAGEEFDPSPENIESRTTRSILPNGFKLALLPKQTRGEQVFATFRILFGTESTLMNRMTAGDLVGGMLMRGTKQRTRQEITDALDRLKAELSINGGVASASGSIETTRENLPEVLRLVSEILREPSFDAEEFGQLKEEQLARLESLKPDPQALGSNAFIRHLSPWAKGHPRYTPTFDERIEWITATTLEDIKQFYREFYGADRGHMAVVGAFDPEAISDIVTDIFGNWSPTTPTERVPSVYRDIKAETIVIETPDKPNAFFLGGLNLDLGDDHPDYPALVLGNYMMGGGMLNSRLAKRLRHEEGVSYAVVSQLYGHPVDGNGQFVALAFYAPENVERLETGFREEIDRALNDGFSAEEVEAAQAGYLQSQGVIRAQDNVLAGILSQGLYINRTLAWDAEQELKIGELTPEQILEAMRRHIDPEKISVVMAGDFAKVKAGAQPEKQ